MARYTRGSSRRKSYGGSKRGNRSYGARRYASKPVRRFAAARPQRVEVVLRHVMSPADAGPAGYVPGVPGLVGVANVPAGKKGKTF